jgi:hypothetical protein
MSGGAITHIAGNDVQVGGQLRQRCAWCGTVLIDYALGRLMVPVDQLPADGSDFRPGTWPVGALVELNGGVSRIVEHEDGKPLPENACGTAHPEVTV